ncbi:serine/threonine-protein kinase [Candidatus Uabimicrobium sp. HlEnr_7]|uniref:serine/threonine-protein kinase n=1 Tax=Candidatus Uabimicrobium helgolandensis TaxID=3095367 RepID=UPI0035575D83
MSIQKRNHLVVQCLKNLDYGISIPMDFLKGFREDLVLHLQRQNVITLEQKKAIHNLMAYYCLLNAVKRTGSMSDVHIENLIKVRCTSLSKGESYSISLNYLEKKLIDQSTAETIAQNLQSSGILNSIESTIIKNWATQLSEKSEENAPKKIGQYQIVELIGSGGMGKVYKAYHPILNKTIAIKVLLQFDSASEKSQQRFFSEAQMMAQLAHPHIVKIHDVGTHNNISYIAMDFIDGPSLKEFLKDNRVSTRKICEMMIEIANAVEYAHKNQIVHRDLKPANLMIEVTTKKIYLMDFGLAKDLSSRNDLTTSGQLLGTPKYMSPEQAEGNSRNVSHLTDIYALGVIFYEMLTGVCPIQGSTQTKIIHNIRYGNVKPITTYKKNISTKLESICLKAMTKSPEKRYTSALKMAEDIENFLQGKATSARTIRLSNHLEKNKSKYTSIIVLCVAMFVCIFLGIYIGRGNNELNTNSAAIINKTKKPSKNIINPERIIKQETIEQQIPPDNKSEWKRIGYKTYNISFLVNSLWIKRIFVKQAAQVKVSYKLDPDKGSVFFYFAKTLHDNLDEAIKSVEQEIWPEKVGYIVNKKKVSSIDINDINGKKVKYYIQTPSKIEIDVEAFYHFGKGRQLYTACVIIPRKKQASEKDKNDLFKSLHSLRRLKPVKSRKGLVIHHKKFGLEYSIDSTWIRKKLNENSSKMLYLYARSTGARVDLRHIKLGKSLDWWIKKLEEVHLQDYEYKKIKEKVQTINGFDGKSVLYKMNVRGKSRNLFAHHFYTIHKNHLVAIYIFCPFDRRKQVMDKILFPLRTLTIVKDKK